MLADFRKYLVDCESKNTFVHYQLENEYPDGGLSGDVDKTMTDLKCNQYGADQIIFDPVDLDPNPRIENLTVCQITTTYFVICFLIDLL